MIVKIFIGPMNYDIDRLYQKDEHEYIIGVEQGAIGAIKKGLKIDLALGDFDSVSEKDLTNIRKNALQTDTFKERKNHTDSYLAIKAALKLDPDEILVYGGMGGRVDHTYANILLLKHGNITLMNDTHRMYCLKPGNHIIHNQHEYISFFALTEVTGLKLIDFSYELTHYDLNSFDPLCISNQGSGKLSFDEGLLLVIESRDKT